MEEFIMREKNFHEGGEGFSTTIEKKNEEIKLKKNFNWN